MLTAFQEHFRQFAENQLVNWPNDDVMISVLTDRSKDRQQRIRAVYDWLHFMKVVRFNGKQLGLELSEGVIDFYDDPSRPKVIAANTSSLMGAFGQLQDRLSTLRKSNGKNGGITSLTSKSLWCCYPESVPIYDGNAEDALRVLGRVINGLPQLGRRCKYQDFLDAWFDLHAKLQVTTFTPAHIKYKIRALDRYLWTLGQ